MADGLVGDQALVGEWDPAGGLWLVRAWVPGPAGSAALPLAGGVEVDVDVASPGILAGLSVEAPADGSRRLGGEVLSAVVAVLGPAVTDALLALQPGPAVRLSPGPVDGRRRSGPQLHPGLGRAALARAASAGAPPLARGLALLEASAAAASLGPRAGFDALASEDAGEGSGVLLELVAAGSLVVDELRTARELAAALRRAAALLGGRPDLAHLADDVDRGRYGPRPQAAAADAARAAPFGARAMPSEALLAPAAAPAAAGAGRLRVVQPVAVDRSHLPSGVAVDDVAAVLAGVAEVEVQLVEAAGRAPGWWARATAPDGTTLALAPVVDAGDDAVARLLVPPTAVGDLEVDLTAEPGTPRPSARLRAAERAVRLGQAAARASRLGLPASSGRWAACGQAWAEAGDEVRAARATDGRRSQEAGPPLAVDDLLER